MSSRQPHTLHQVHHHGKRQHWALLPFLAGVLIGLAISTVVLIQPSSDTVTNNVYISIGENDFKRRFEGKFADFDHLLKELHMKDRAVHKLSEEVKMRDTVYFAVMIQDRSLESLSTIKRTWASDIASKNINFFVTSEESKVDSIIHISPSEQLEIEVLRYICTHKLNQTKWFFLAYDDLYIKAHELEDFLLSAENSQSELGYIGKPIKRDPIGRVCMPGPGSVLSFSVLSELCPKLDECQKHQDDLETDCVLGECVRNQLPSLQCAKDDKLHELFLKFEEGEKGSIVDPKNHNRMSQSLTIFPVQDPKLVYSIHQAVLSARLNESQLVIQELKRSADQMEDLLPQTDIRVYSDTHKTEQTLTEDDIIPWKLISNNKLMSCVESNPAMKIKSLWKNELNLLGSKSIEYINSREEENYSFKRMVNVYWRVNTVLGTEYIIDFEAKVVGTESDYSIPAKRFRVSLVRHYNELEVNPVVQYMDTSRHVTIGVLITNEVADRFGQFMSKLGSVLETDQSFDLVAIHMRGTKEQGEVSSEISHMISMYESKYPTANFKVIKSPTLLSRSHGISLLVQELRPNDLVFLSDIHLNFDRKFLDRCRSYPIQGQQVYFPIPFNQMDTSMLAATNHSMLEDNITQHSGYWLVDTHSTACLYAVDIHSAIQQEDSKGLTDKINMEELYSTFVKKGYSVVRGVDGGLRRVHSKDRTCPLDFYGETHEQCKSLPESYEKLYLKTQLSVLLLDHEGEHAHKKY